MRSPSSPEGGAGYARIYPADSPEFGYGTVNFEARGNRSNSLLISAGPDPDAPSRLRVKNRSGGPIHVLVDSMGYFGWPSETTQLSPEAIAAEAAFEPSVDTDPAAADEASSTILPADGSSQAELDAALENNDGVWVQEQGTVTASSLKPPWASCSWKDVRKEIKVYSRGRATASNVSGKTLAAGNAQLLCGYNEVKKDANGRNYNSGYGYHHIVAGHRSQWQGVATQAADVSWMDSADKFMYWSLRAPEQVTYRAQNDTYCYSHLMKLVNKKTNKVVGYKHGRTVVAAGSKNVITAYPADKGCAGK